MGERSILKLQHRPSLRAQFVQDQNANVGVDPATATGNTHHFHGERQGSKSKNRKGRSKAIISRRRYNHHLRKSQKTINRLLGQS